MSGDNGGFAEYELDADPGDATVFGDATDVFGDPTNSETVTGTSGYAPPPVWWFLGVRPIADISRESNPVTFPAPPRRARNVSVSDCLPIEDILPYVVTSAFPYAPTNEPPVPTNVPIA